MAAASDHSFEMDDEIYDRVDRLPERDYDDPQRPRAHPVLPPPSRRQTYYARPDPRAPRPAGQAPYYTQEAFGHHAYIEPRARPRMTPPPPPPPGHWGGYQLPPPQPYQRRPPRSPGPYDPRGQYRLPQPLYGYPATGYPPSPPYAPGPSGATVDPNIFKADPYWRHPGIPPSPSPDPGRSDVPLPSYVGPIRPNKQTKVAGKKKKKKKSTARVSQRVASAHISPSHSRNSVLVSSSALPQENLPKLAQRQDSGVVYPVSQDSDSPYQPIEVAADITSLMSFEEIIPHLNKRGCRDLVDEIDLTSYSTSPVNGGGLGDVYKGKLKNGTPIAIKTMRPAPDDTIQKGLKRATRELYVWSKCRHKNVQALLGLVKFQDQIGMVSVWEMHGNIKAYLERNPEADPCQLSVQVADGLSYLHQVGVTHGDLKGDNILVSEDGAPMLADFGCSTLRECTLSFTDTTASLWTVRWAAPEVLDGENECTPEADVYALGMTILEMITGKVPWPGLTETAVMTAVLFRKETHKRPLDFIPHDSKQGDNLWQILERCWVEKPADRPSAAEVGVLMQAITRDGLHGVDER